MEMLPRKALVITGCLPQQICIETNEPIDSPSAQVFTVKGRCAIETLDCIKVEGCKYYFVLGECMAQHGTGYYLVKLMEDCDVCETICVQLKRECFIVSTSVSETKTTKDCC